MSQTRSHQSEPAWLSAGGLGTGRGSAPQHPWWLPVPQQHPLLLLGALGRLWGAAGMSYTTPVLLAGQIGYRDLANPRLQQVCDAATEQINFWIGATAELAPVPATLSEVALSLAVDIWKQPDATFGIMGLSETGPVRVARDLVARYDSLLIPFYQAETAWGVA